MKALEQNDATYSQQGDFEDWLKLAGKDYEYLLEQVSWHSLLSKVRSVLDVGCGKAFFPNMLFDHVDISGSGIAYSALDPVQSCLDRTEEILSHHPLRFDGFYKTTLEQAALPNRYDLVWCLKSLYLVDEKRLGQSLAKIERLLGPQGVAILFHCTGDSFIIDYHNNVFNRSSLAREKYYYNTAEKIEESLRSVGITYRHICGEHTTRTPTQDKESLANYLCKGSLITPMPFEALSRDEQITAHLTERIDGDDYLFHHRYKIVIFGPGMDEVATRSHFARSVAGS
jgi:SAM-dependent methyltransferase